MPNTTYTASVNVNDESPTGDDPRGIEVVLYASVPAGICGPCGEITLGHGAPLSSVDNELESRGFVREGEWMIRTGYAGLFLECALRKTVDPIQSAVRVIEWNRDAPALRVV